MSNPVMAVRVVATVAELKKALAEGKAEIVTTTAAMSKMAAAFRGDALVRQAHAVVGALHEVGTGALSTQEAARHLTTLDKAIAKLEATSKPVPPAMVATAASLRKIVDEAKKPELSQMGQWFRDFGTQALASATGFLSAQSALNMVSAAGTAFIGFVRNSITSASEAEAAQVKLTAALRQHGTATPEVVAQYNAMAAQMQRTTVYSDDLTTQMQALLVQVGGLMPSQMQSALDASANLSAGLGIDLQQATMLVAKAAAGHTEALGRYGITVSEAALESEGFTAVLDAVNRQFGGQAAAQVESYAGKVQVLANSWDDLQEAVGRAIILDPIVLAAINQSSRATDDASASTFTLAGGVDRLFESSKRFVGFVPFGAQMLDILKRKFHEAEQEAALFNATTAALNRGDDFLKRFRETTQDQSAQRILAAGMAEAARLAEQEAEKKRAAAAATEKLAEANRKYRETLDFVLTSAAGYEAVIESIDGTVVAAIQHYREQNVDLQRLGEVYGLTAVQVNALSQAEAAEQATLSALTRGNQELSRALKERARQSVEVLAASTRPLPGLDPAKVAGLNTAKGLGLGALLGQDLQSFFSGGGFSKLIVQGLTGGGGLSGGLQAAASQLGGNFTQNWAGAIQKHFPGKFGEALSGLVGPLGALAGPFLAKVFSIGGPSQAELAGREAARRFEQGIVAGLSEAQRLEAGNDRWRQTVVGVRDAYLAVGRSAAEAEAAVARLWAAERQGPEAVAAVQASIQGVLDQAARVRQAAAQFGPSRTELQQMARDAKATYDFMLASGEYTAEQLAAAFQDSQEKQARALGINTDAQQKNLEALKQGLADLTAQRDQLWQQIAAEAPEEVMGVIEAGQRAQLATLDQQIADQNAKLAAQAEAAATALELALSAVEPAPVHVPIVWDVPGLPGIDAFDGRPQVTPLADGGFGVAERPTLLLVGEKGREEFAASGANRTFEQTSLGTGGAGGDLELRRELAGLRRDFKQMPEMLSLAMRASLRQVRR